MYIAVSALAVVLGVAALVLALRDRLPGWPTVWGLAALEVALVGVFIGEIVHVVTADRQIDTGSFIGYLVGLLILVPAGTAWAFFDRSRWGVTAIVVACFAVPVMLLRLHDIWEAGVG